MYLMCVSESLINFLYAPLIRSIKDANNNTTFQPLNWHMIMQCKRQNVILLLLSISSGSGN